MKNKAIEMRIFSASSLAGISEKYSAWQRYVNDPDYYSIIEKELVAGNNEYVLIIRYERSN